jgi:hypothetical protein
MSSVSTRPVDDPTSSGCARIAAAIVARRHGDAGRAVGASQQRNCARHAVQWHCVRWSAATVDSHRHRLGGQFEHIQHAVPNRDLCRVIGVDVPPGGAPSNRTSASLPACFPEQLLCSGEGEWPFAAAGPLTRPRLALRVEFHVVCRMTCKPSRFAWGPMRWVPDLHCRRVMFSSMVRADRPAHDAGRARRDPRRESTFRERLHGVLRTA